MELMGCGNGIATAEFASLGPAPWEITSSNALQAAAVPTGEEGARTGEEAELLCRPGNS